MTGPLHDGWPAFWFAPWRWAHADWHRRYGVPAALQPAGLAEQRLLFRGWIDTFALRHHWAPPTDNRWFEALAAPQGMMLDAAAILGWIGLVRAGGVKDMGSAADRRLSRALRYREVSCMDTCFVPSDSGRWDATASGLDVLLAMAEAGWPDVAGRIAMMRAPQRRMADACVVVERVDVALCVTIWLAVLRWLRAPDTDARP